MPDNFTLIFDLGNTLAPFNNKEISGIQKDLADFVCGNFEIDSSDFTREWNLARAKDMSQSNATGKEHEFASRFYRVTGLLGCKADDHLMQAARKVMINSFVKHTEVDLNVRRALVKLAPKYRLGVLSNYLLTEPIHEVLKRAGVYDCFEKVLVSKEIGFSKPDARAFSAIVNGMKADPAKTVFIGDDFFADIEGAVKYGLKALWTWAFCGEINGQPCPVSKDICITKTREDYFRFLSEPGEYLGAAQN